MTTEQRDARDVVRECVAALDQYQQAFNWLAGDDWDGVEERPREYMSRAEELARVARHHADELATQPPQRDGAEPVDREVLADYIIDKFRSFARPIDGRLREDLRMALTAAKPLYTAPPPDERDAEIARLRDELNDVRGRLTEKTVQALHRGLDIGRLEADLTATRAQCDDLIRQNEHLQNQEACAESARKSAVAQCDAFKADAERYRIARELIDDVSEDDAGIAGLAFDCQIPLDVIDETPSAELLDMVCDFERDAAASDILERQQENGNG